MRTWLQLSLLASVPFLGACSKTAEVDVTPPADDEEVVQGGTFGEAPAEKPAAEKPIVEVPADTGTTDQASPGGSQPTDDGVVDAVVTPRDQEDEDRAALAERAERELGITNVTDIDDLGSDLEVEEGTKAIAWRDLAIESDDVEDILDKLLYPDQYDEDEYNLPEHIKALDGQKVAIVGYQIPLEWEGTTVPEFMLVGDLLGCCFGGAPRPDEWVNVKMKGKGAEYFPYFPVIVTGTLRIEGIEDDAGYAAGCYHIDAESCEKEL